MNEVTKVFKKMPIRLRCVVFGVPALIWLALLIILMSFSRIWADVPKIQDSFKDWLDIAKGIIKAWKTNSEI